MKKIIFLCVVFMIIFIIYFFNRDNKIYIVSIGDYESRNNTFQTNSIKYLNNSLEKYINYSNINDYRIIDLIRDINENKQFLYKKNKYKMDNVLIKADIIILTIGNNDLNYYKELNNNKYVDEIINDLNDLFKLLRKYSKEKIVIYNFKEENNMYKYANKRLSVLANKYDIKVLECEEKEKNLLEYIKTIY